MNKTKNKKKYQIISSTSGILREGYWNEMLICWKKAKIFSTEFTWCSHFQFIEIDKNKKIVLDEIKPILICKLCGEVVDMIQLLNIKIKSYNCNCYQKKGRLDI